MAQNFHPLNVLVVDDESLIRWAIARTLSAAGHRVIEAGDGASAMAALSQGAPDVVLLDNRLPDARGLSLLGWIRRMAPTSAVVMMTADQSPELVAQAEALGAARVMQKPFDMADVEPALIDAQTGGPGGDPGRRRAH